MKVKLFLNIWLGFCIIGLFFCCSIATAQVFVMGNSQQQCLEGNGQSQKHSLVLGHFSSVSTVGAFFVTISSNSQLEDITIKTDKNLLPFISIETKEDILTIKASRSICSASPIEININALAIDKIISEGANDISLLNFKNSRLEVDLDGSGTLKVVGETALLKAIIGGSSEFRAGELHSENVDILSSGSSESSVCATRELKAKSDGASEIVYYGHPELLIIDEQEAGEVRAGLSEK